MRKNYISYVKMNEQEKQIEIRKWLKVELTGMQKFLIEQMKKDKSQMFKKGLTLNHHINSKITCDKNQRHNKFLLTGSIGLAIRLQNKGGDNI